MTTPTTSAPKYGRITGGMSSQFSKALEKVDRLKPLADGLGISMAQLALAWCLQRTGLASVIIGATKLQQLEDNARASGLSLPDDVMSSIDAIFPPPTT